MILDSGKRQYRVVSEIFHGSVNDVVVCQDLGAAGSTYKTVWLIKKREIARTIIEAFQLDNHQSENGIQKKIVYEECFLFQGNMCFVLPYAGERPLEHFYLSVIENGICGREHIWMQVITTCMTCCLPDCILYLLLHQGQIQVGTDGSIWFQYNIDFSEFDEKRDTKSCVLECAKLIQKLMQQEQMMNLAGELLQRKLERKSYTQFIDLYKDIHLIQDQSNKREKKSLKKVLEEKKDTIYKVILVISIVLLTIVVIMLIFRLIFGDFSFYRLFRPAIEQIGTESLLK